MYQKTQTDQVTNIQKKITLEQRAEVARMKQKKLFQKDMSEFQPVPIDILNKSERMGAIPHLSDFSDYFQSKDKNAVSVALGVDNNGSPVYCDLTKAPSLLIAGTTGSGKTNCLYSIIGSIMLRYTPTEVRLLLIDPKGIEFNKLKKIPYLIGPVNKDVASGINELKVLCKIIDNRFESLKMADSRSVAEMNHIGFSNFPFIVAVIDDLASLTLSGDETVKEALLKIASDGPKVSVHLVAATSISSGNVLTRSLKSNIPSRIAFATASAADSRTILDETGAEKLSGPGELLYKPKYASRAIRVHGVYVPDCELETIANYAMSEAHQCFFDEYFQHNDYSYYSGGDSVTDLTDAAEDPLYDEIKKYVITAQKASTSIIQRRFGVGYNRAARIIDMLEEQGVIGPDQGSHPREVYISQNDN